MDEDKLREWWNSGVTVHEIARRFGVHPREIQKARDQFGIADRHNKYRQREIDPTPDEIAERAAAIKAKNIERLRAPPWHPG